MIHPCRRRSGSIRTGTSSPSISRDGRSARDGGPAPLANTRSHWRREPTMFADLHRPGDPLILPNAWDHASGAALAAAGFKAIGTTSLGVAAAIGVPDGANATKEATYN